MLRTSLIAAAGLLCVPLTSHALGTPEQVCQATKNKVAGQYAACRQEAERQLVTSNDSIRYAAMIGKCEQKFALGWQRANKRAALLDATCLDAPLTAAGFKIVIDNHTDNVAGALDGDGFAPGTSCGNGSAETGEHCDGGDLAGASCGSLGFSGGALGCTAACAFDLSACVVGNTGRLPVTGQTLNLGPGSDGDVQAGQPFAYVDNGNGTITDLTTNLVWERKVGLDAFANTLCASEATATCGNPHNANNRYTWSALLNYSGTIVTIFLEQMNNRCHNDTTVACTTDAHCAGPGGPCGFTGHRDWRVPNLRELQSLFDAGEAAPAIHPIFHTSPPGGCGTACTDVTNPTCGCTMGGAYWTSTAFATGANAWTVHFHLGLVSPTAMSGFGWARAVRTGP